MTTTIALQPTGRRANDYGVLLESETVHQMSGPGLHNPGYDHRITVWENRQSKWDEAPATVELDFVWEAFTSDDLEAEVQEWLDQVGLPMATLQFEILEEHGPAGGAAVIRFHGTRRELEQLARFYAESGDVPEVTSQVVDPHGYPTEDRYSYLTNAVPGVLTATPHPRDPQGEPLAVGQDVELTIHGYSLGTFTIVAGRLADPHLERKEGR